ncbi:MAG: permease-like cell division protein FtsX, partial [Pseudomonadota bacterium]
MAKAQRSGASRAGPPVSGRLRTYARNHAQTFISSLGRLWEQPFSSFMTVLVIGMALALPAVLQMVVQNARSATGQWDNVLDVSAYLAIDQTTENAEAIAATLRARSDIDTVEVIPADRALADFREYSGFGDALDALSDNPLPATLVITPAASHRGDVALAGLADDIGGYDGVDFVQLDTAWVKRFHSILDVVRRGAWLAGLLLAGA